MMDRHGTSGRQPKSSHEGEGTLKRPERVGVLLGGISREREVSLRSGEAVAKALTGQGFAVTLFDVKDRELTGIEDHEFDAVFLALHGHFGEDGGVQRRLEKLAIPYTGSGVRASTLAFDKIRAKRWFELAGLRTPRWVVLDAAMSVEEAEQTTTSASSWSRSSFRAVS
ncbi:MAG: D-alanine--D-alanine ligase [Planctomycetota bacterium]|jgi:D-alanine-D-alanine ligase